MRPRLHRFLANGVSSASGPRLPAGNHGYGMDRKTRALGAGENKARGGLPLHRVKTARSRQEALETGSGKDVHRDDELWPDLPQDLDHLLLVQCVGAVNRQHDDIDRAQLGKVRRRQGVVQVAEMRDAQIGDLKDKDRVAVVAGPAQLANIGRHIADANITVFQVMVGNPARRVPARARI